MGQTPDYLLISFLFMVLFVAAIIDIRIQKIPNLLTYPAATLVIIYHSIVNGSNGLFFSLLGGVVGLSLLFVPYLLKGMGAGDAKLLAVVGATIGAKAVFYAFLCIAIVGGIYALIVPLTCNYQFRRSYKNLLISVVNLLLMRKYIPDQTKNKNMARLSYGVAIGLGTGIYMTLKVFIYV